MIRLTMSVSQLRTLRMVQYTPQLTCSISLIPSLQLFPRHYPAQQWP